MREDGQEQLRQLRAKAHMLHPIVTVGRKGLSDPVFDELNRALSDHELIKIKLAIGDKILRHQVIQEICHRSGASLVQHVGRVATLVRPNPVVHPKKSNLQRRRH
tara:strand:+ start:234 stop:548 length:315 start_codon:yes stop_codon:yes gene_type:complete